MRYLVIICLLVCSSFLWSAFLRNHPITYTQPDGSELNLFVTGDEYYRRVHDSNDYTILKHPETGFAVYAVQEGKSLQASEYRVGLVDPVALGIPVRLFDDMTEVKERFRREQAERTSENRGSPVGLMNNIVGFVRFADQTEFPTGNNYNYYNNMFNSLTQASLKDYYAEVSSTQLTINSYLYPPPTGAGFVISLVADTVRAYYTPYHPTTNPIGYRYDYQKETRLWYLMVELLEKIRPHVPAGLNLDTDNDGKLDGLTYIFRGGVDGWMDILWPTHSYWPSPYGTLNGAEVYRTVRNFEEVLDVPIVIHETGHMIGFPDLYHYSHDNFTPVGPWDLMAWQSPQHSLTYMKWKYGTWFQNIPEIVPTSTPTTYTLPAIDSSPYACYKIQSTYPNQFYMLEYRRQMGRYESTLPGSGLVITRIMTEFEGEPLRGNADGPPDEIYVFRPGGSPSTNGDVNIGFFSSNVGRTAIHNNANPKPWLYQDSSPVTTGNLVITNIGAAGGNTISFDVSNVAPYVPPAPKKWYGWYSSNWHDPYNWSGSEIPNANTDVIISTDHDPDYWPVIGNNEAYCGQLRIDPGFGVSLTVGNANLYVNRGLEVSNTLILNHPNSNMYVQGDVIWKAGAMLNVTNENIDIYCSGNMIFEPTSFVQMNMGHIEFNGPENTYLSNQTGYTILNNVRINKSSTGSFSIASDSSYDFEIKGNLTNYANSKCFNYYSGNVRFRGNLTDYNTSGGIKWGYGYLVLPGTSQSITMSSNASHLSALRVNLTNTLTLGSNLKTLGSIIIQTGVFNPANYTLFVGGSWNNTQGAGGFLEGTGRVVFDGPGDQYCTFSENFYILELNKPSGSFKIYSAGTTVSCASYVCTAGNLTVENGTFIANDMADTGITGTVTINNGFVHFYQDSSQPLDLRGNLHIYNSGELHLYGGSRNSRWPYDGNASITLGAGIIHVHNNGVILWWGNTLTTNITGGILRVDKNFASDRSDYIPTGTHVLEMVSSSVTTLDAHPVNIANLRINKTTGMVYLNSNIECSGWMIIQSGTLHTNSYEVDVAGGVSVYGKLRMEGSDDKVISGGDFTWHSGSVAQMEYGTLECYSNFWIYEGADFYLSDETDVKLLSTAAKTILLRGNRDQFGRLFIGGSSPGAGYTIHSTSTRDLNVYGDLIITAGNELDLGNRNLNLVKDLYLSGKLDVHAQAVVNLGKPYFGTTSILDIAGGSYVFHSSQEPTITHLQGTLNLSSGTFEAVHNEIIVQNGAINNISGGTIICDNLTATFANTFQPSGGTVKLTSNPWIMEKTLNVSNGNYLQNLITESITGFSLGAALNIYGNLTLNTGLFNTAGYNLTCQGHINTSSYFKIGSGGNLYMSNVKYLNVNNGGTLHIYGTAANRARITCTAGWYNLEVNSGGTIKAEYSIFEKLRDNGVNVKAGSIVDNNYAFRGCIFQNGYSGGVLLTLHNSQSIAVFDAQFPTNTWSGSYNVRKNMESGMVNFVNCTGAYSGEAFENDTYQRIEWMNVTAATDLRILSAKYSALNPYIGDYVTLRVVFLNAGLNACGTSYLDLYYNSPQEPALYQTGDDRMLTGPMPACVLQEFFFTINTYDPAHLGRWFTRLQIDTNQQVAEAEENNNHFGPELISWASLPCVENLVVLRPYGTNNIKLDWDYPIGATDFIIYRSTEPYFVPGPATFHTSVGGFITEYSEQFTGIKYFYKVTAERTARTRD